MRSDRVSYLVAALLVAAPAAARAEASVARLDVDAAPSCSTRDELVARVAARSTRIRFVSDGVGIPTMTARIDAGHVWINSGQIIFPNTAWGGFKASGIGRELGPWGLGAYLGVKHLTVAGQARP